MATIACPACGKTRTPLTEPRPGALCKCRCGHIWCPNPVVPVAAPNVIQVVAPKEVQTIERTSKKWKGLQAAGGVTAVIACAIVIVLTIDANQSGQKPSPARGLALITLLGGMLVWSFGRLAAWWHHG
jgi:hypothetical protein